MGQEFDVEVTAQDVQNVRDEDRRVLLGGRTSTQQFLHNLQTDDSVCLVDFRRTKSIVSNTFYGHTSGP